MDNEMFVVFEEEDGAGGGAGGVATGAAPDAAASASNGETPGGANVADGAAAGGQTSGGASITSDTALPAELAEKFGVKTLGELGEFAGTMHNAARQYRDHAQALQQRADQTGNPNDQRKADVAAAGAAVAEQKAYRLKDYGFESQDKWAQALKTDSLDATTTLIERIAEAKAKAIFESQSKPIVDEVQAATQERFQREVTQVQTAWAQKFDAFTKADPRFVEKGADGKPGPLFGALSKVLTKHDAFIRHNAAQDPNFNQYEWAAEMVLGALARSGQQTSETRLELANNIAGAARPGAGGGAIPKQQSENETPKQTIDRMNATLQAQGKQPMSHAEMTQLEDSLKKFNF